MTDPKSNVVTVDDEDYFLFSASYTHEGKHWSFDFWAKNFEDAEARVQEMRETLKLDGQSV